MERPPSSHPSIGAESSGIKIQKKTLFDPKIVELLKSRKATALFCGDGDDILEVAAAGVSARVVDDQTPHPALSSVAQHSDKLAHAPSDPSVSSAPASCRTCSISFRAIEEQHAHYKSSWHCYNLKRKLSGLTAVSQIEFNELGDAGELSSDNESGSEDQTDSAIGPDHQNSSSAGEEEADDENDESEKSESEKEEEPEREKSALSAMPESTTQCITLFRAVLGHMPTGTTATEAKEFYLRKFDELSKANHLWVFFMCSGGHFAAAVFDKLKILHHKTIHRYTTRRKQGGTQSNKDNRSAGSGPQSAGAQIRRRNEKKLREEIVALLNEWKEHLRKANVIWLVHSILSTVQLTSYSADELSKLQREKQQLEEEKEEKNSAEENSEKILREGTAEAEAEEETDLLLEASKSGNLDLVQQLLQDKYVRPIPKDAMKISSPLYEAAKRGNAEIVKVLLKSVQKSELNVTIPSDRFKTAIIAAATSGNEEIVQLLLDSGADPTIRGIDSKNAYASAGENKKVQKCISRFASSNPTAFDWQRANIPILSAEQDREREKAKSEKLKQKRKHQKEKQKQKKVEEEKLKKEEEEKEKVRKELQQVEISRKLKESQLSERERRALAAETRLKPTSNRMCDQCKQPLPLVPFERFEYKYCSTKCVQAHKAIIGK